MVKAHNGKRQPSSKSQRKPKVRRLIPPTRESAWTNLQGWCALTGMSDGAVYNAISRGDLEAKKLGKRVMINVRQGLAWLDSLPPANINLARAPRRSGTRPPLAGPTP